MNACTGFDTVWGEMGELQKGSAHADAEETGEREMFACHSVVTSINPIGDGLPGICMLFRNKCTQ